MMLGGGSRRSRSDAVWPTKEGLSKGGEALAYAGLFLAGLHLLHHVDKALIK